MEAPMDTSTTYKSLAAGFAAGVVSTGAFALGFHTIGAVLWAASVLYVVYKRIS